MLQQNLTVPAHAESDPCQARPDRLSPARSHACVLYAQGLADLHERDAAAAERSFTASLAADPTLTPAYRGRASARYKLTHYRAAQADLLIVLDRDPALQTQYYNTTAALRDALHAPRYTADDDYIGALVGIIIGDNAGAFELLNAAISANPQLAEAYHFRGNIYDDMGDRQRAEADYRHALALNPRSYGTLYAMGFLLGAMGRYREERDYMTRAIAVHPSIAEAWIERGIVREKLGDVNGAIADETQALRLGQDSDASMVLRVCYVNRGNARAYMGNWTGALADARRAIAIDSSDALAYNLAGWALINLNRHSEAEHSLDRALTLNPAFVSALVNRCEARLVLHAYSASQGDCTRAIAIDPSEANAYLDRGVDRLYLGNIAGARADLELALRMFRARHDATGVRLAELWLGRLGL